MHRRRRTAIAAPHDVVAANEKGDSDGRGDFPSASPTDRPTRRPASPRPTQVPDANDRADNYTDCPRPLNGTIVCAAELGNDLGREPEHDRTAKPAEHNIEQPTAHH
jgi:hypothetical protein